MPTELHEIVSHIQEELKKKGIFTLLKSQECPHLDGIWGGGTSAVLAALAKEKPDHAIIVLTPTQKDAQNILDDFPLFDQRPILPFPWQNRPHDFMPDQETDPECDAAERFSTFIPDVSIGERLRVLKALLRHAETETQTDSAAPIITAPLHALLSPCPDPSHLRQESLTLTCGTAFSMEELIEWLLTHGFQNTTAVEFPGEFFARGGLLDIFAIDWERPLRIEFFGDDIDSIREFDLETQRSLRSLDSVSLGSFTSMLNALHGGVPLTKYLSASKTLFFLLEPENAQLQGRRFYQAQENPETLFSPEELLREVMKFQFFSVSSIGTATFGETFSLSMESVERFSGEFSKVCSELDRFGIGQTVYVLCPNDAEKARLETIFGETHLAKRKAVHYRLGTISDGFRLVSTREMVISSSALFRKEEVRRSAVSSRKKTRQNGSEEAGIGAGTGDETNADADAPSTKTIDSFTDLQEGDFVVHVSFGIARYRGLKLLEPLKSKSQTQSVPRPLSSISDTAAASDSSIFRQVQGRKANSPHVPNANGAEEHMVLEFRDGVLIYVPTSKIALVQKYICGKNAEPALSPYGGRSWGKMKEEVAESVKELAGEMLETQAERLSCPGLSFPIETPLQNEFDAVFPYTETPDQLKAIEAIRADMASPRPMDRLLCGDVGFGKTEIAMRAAFTAVEAGFQVGIMAPTTVLVEQHLRTFRARMATFPVTIESISRFASAAQQKEILKRTAEGKVDILIGTHRLASSDVSFRNLGLLIIDEEQKFGVRIKETLKKLRSTVDVLTMTATPIPRTLHMSLLGLRDISSLETPPADRRAIETHVVRYQPQLLRNAILREIDRNGQIFFIHNRVRDLQEVADALRQIVPEARIAIGHAQMAERELEKVMLSFVNHDVDILVSTTIVETGLDIPNANTIFINEANNFGLAELHQLRGRVGRFKNHAYCYLLVHGANTISEVAIRRLKAIEEFAHLGAGFSIAMRDLEIRGTGNILGTKQSGQIGMVGYELYCDLLDAAVRRLRRLPPRETVDVDVDLPVTAYLPHHYVPDMRTKMELYRRLSRLTRPAHVSDFESELIDRFGKLPLQAILLLKLYRVRILAHQWLIHSIHRDGDFLMFEFYSKKALEPLASRPVGSEKKTLRFIDEHSACLPLDEETANSASDSEKLLNYVEMLLRDS